MAGPLTWRNVSAPDASVAMQGLKQMSDSLNQAFTGGSDALGAFKDQRAAAADQAGLAASLKFTDPAQYQEALRNGLIPQENMTAEGTANLGNRATQLLNQQSLGQDFKVGEQNLLKGDQALAAGEQLYKQRDVAASTLAHSFDRQLRDEKRADTAYDDNLFAQQTGLGITNLTQDPASAMTRFNAMKGTMTPSQERATRAYLETAYKVPFTGMGSPEEAIPMDLQGLPLDIPRSTYDRTVADTPHSGKPMSASSIDEWEVSAKELRDATRGRKDLRLAPDEGSSAGGPYQMIFPTLRAAAVDVFGEKNVGSVVLTPPVQEQLAEHIYNQNKGGDLSKTWQGLEKLNRPAGYYKDIPWAEARKDILREEVSVTPTSTEAQQLTAAAKPKAPMTRAEQMQAQYDMPVTRGDGTVLPPQGQEVNGSSPLGGAPSGIGFLQAPTGLIEYPVGAILQGAGQGVDMLRRGANSMVGGAPLAEPNKYGHMGGAIKDDGSARLASANLGVERGILAALGSSPEVTLSSTPAKQLAQAANPATNGNATPIDPSAAPSTKAIEARVLDQQDTLMRDRVQSGVGQDYIQNLDNQDSVGTVIAEMRKGDFSGTNEGDVLSLLNDIVDATGVNYKTAGAAMSRALDDSGFWSSFNRVIPRKVGGGTNDLGGGKRMNDKKLDFMIEALKNNTSLGQNYDQVQQKTNTTTLAGALDARNKANEALTKVRARFANGMTDAAEVMRYEYRQKAAERALAAAR